MHKQTSAGLSPLAYPRVVLSITSYHTHISRIEYGPRPLTLVYEVGLRVRRLSAPRSEGRQVLVSKDIYELVEASVLRVIGQGTHLQTQEKKERNDKWGGV
jgi:hypothetical protein